MKPGSPAAGKTRSNGPVREYPRRRGVRRTLPEKTDSQTARRCKGPRGGRPSGFGEDRFKKRGTVERATNRLKQFRAVATCGTTGAATSSPAPPQRQPLLLRTVVACCRRADAARTGCPVGQNAARSGLGVRFPAGVSAEVMTAWVWSTASGGTAGSAMGSGSARAPSGSMAR
ncbi:hypothetical protein GCM10010398_74270 [Streptomyces fimbriatus]